MEECFEHKQSVDRCENCKLARKLPEEQTVSSRDGNSQLSGTTGQSRLDYSLPGPVTESVQRHMGRERFQGYMGEMPGREA